MSEELAKLDNILTDSQMNERFPDEPESRSKLFTSPTNIEIREYEDQTAYSGISWNMTTPFVDEEVLEGKQHLTDIDLQIIRELTSLLHEGPLRSAYASEEMMEEFDENAVIGEVIMPGRNPSILQMRHEDILWDKMTPLEENPELDIDNWTNIIENKLSNNRILSTTLPPEEGYFAEDRLFSFIYNEEEDPKRVSDELSAIVDNLNIERKYAADNTHIVHLDGEENNPETKDRGKISGEDIVQNLTRIDGRVIPNEGDNPGDYSLNFHIGSVEDLRPEIEDGEIVLYDGDEELERRRLYGDQDYRIAEIDYSDITGDGEIYLTEKN